MPTVDRGRADRVAGDSSRLVIDLDAPVVVTGPADLEVVRRPPRWWRPPPALAMFAVALVLSFARLHAVWAHPTSEWPGITGDPEQSMWFLSWLPFALGHLHTGLLTSNLLYPAGGNLMWNTSVLLPAALMSPVTALGGPTLSYNLLQLLAPAVTALCAFVAFRRWVPGAIGPAAGALLFAFGPFAAIQARAHLQLVLLAFVPLTLIACDEVLVRQRWRPLRAGALLGLLAAAQLLTAEDVLAMELLVAAVGLLLLVAMHPRAAVHRLRRALAGVVAAGVVFALLAGYPLYMQFHGPRRVLGAIHRPNFYVTDLLNFVLPVHQLGGGAAHRVVAAFTGNQYEWTGYLGVPLLLALVAAAAVCRRSPVVRFALLLAAVVAVLSMGRSMHVAGHDTGIWLPFSWVVRLPLMQNVIPVRLTLLVDLFAALVFAFFVRQLVGWWARRPRRALPGWALLGLVVASFVPSGMPVSDVAVPAFFTSRLVQRVPAGSVALVLPYVRGPHTESAMLWQARSGMRFRMPEGWLIVPGPHQGPWSPLASLGAALSGCPAVAGTPAGEDRCPPRVPPDRLARGFRGMLRSLHVRTVIVGPMSTEQRAVRWLSAFFGRPPQWTGGVAVWSGLRWGRASGR